MTQIKRIVILGGGSAGWLTAGVIAAEHDAARPTGLEVTVLESPEVAPIGVGEGTWPTMRDTLRCIGVTESDFVRECAASFKQGSRFDGWATGAAGERYYHPFVLPQGYSDINLASGWLQRHAEVPFADLVSFQPHLCAHDKAPKQAATPEYAAVANYAYHLDAGKFGPFLRRHCVERLGVRHVAGHMTGIRTHENGDIAALETQSHGELAGDLFIDCTGLASLLLGQHYGVRLRSQQHVLFNDSALAVQVPYGSEDHAIASQTIATAQRSGWIWDIGLPTRRGIGYVYSSAHTTDEAAERELRHYVESTGAAGQIEQPRKLSFNPGFRERFWHRNCVAIGLSAGFIEPLEASALVLIELSAGMLSDTMPATRDEVDIVAQRFNHCFAYRWERVIEFLKMHYVLTQRTDAAFWRDHRREASIPQRLKEQLALWQHRPPSRHDFSSAEEVFPSASYQYVLYGMGFRPQPSASTRRRDDAERASGCFRETAAMTARMLGALPTNRELLRHIQRKGLPRI